MSWAAHAIGLLGAGKPAVINPRGHSMRPRVCDRATVHLAPVCDPAALQVGDVVLVRVKGRVFLHLISATDPARVQISNNRGHVNGWVSRAAVNGIAVKIINP